jgi:hypothetical protein
MEIPSRLSHRDYLICRNRRNGSRTAGASLLFCGQILANREILRRKTSRWLLISCRNSQRPEALGPHMRRRHGWGGGFLIKLEPGAAPSLRVKRSNLGRTMAHQRKTAPSYNAIIAMAEAPFRSKSCLCLAAAARLCGSSTYGAARPGVCGVVRRRLCGCRLNALLAWSARPDLLPPRRA